MWKEQKSGTRGAADFLYNKELKYMGKKPFYFKFRQKELWSIYL